MAVLVKISRRTSSGSRIFPLPYLSPWTSPFVGNVICQRPPLSGSIWSGRKRVNLSLPTLVMLQLGPCVSWIQELWPSGVSPLSSIKRPARRMLAANPRFWLSWIDLVLPLIMIMFWQVLCQRSGISLKKLLPSETNFPMRLTASSSRSMTWPSKRNWASLLRPLVGPLPTSSLLKKKKRKSYQWIGP